MNNLSSRLAELGQREAAADTARQVVAIKQRVLGLEHPDTLLSMHKLSKRLDELGERKAAVDTVRQVLTMQRRVLGFWHPATVASMKVLMWRWLS